MHRKKIRVALTMDDVPMHGALRSGWNWTGVHRSILNAFARHQMPPVTGFVIGQHVRGQDQIRALRSWMAHGHPIANHTYSHVSPDACGAQAYIDDIGRNELVLQALVPLQTQASERQYFRYPYLASGSEAGCMLRIVHALSEQNYTIAPVTMSFADWYWNEAYMACTHSGHEEAFHRLEALFLYWAEATLHYHIQRRSQDNDVALPHVIALHAGVFTARVIAKFIAICIDCGVSFISLDEAMASRIRQQTLHGGLVGVNLSSIRETALGGATSPPPLPRQAIAQITAPRQAAAAAPQ
jgi:peptidoglycan/xylan/chitin deacetylase (PgdA/CDA1 family)